MRNIHKIFLLPEKSSCGFYPTCEECRSDPACGWCDDGSGTGLGKCLPGGNRSPDDQKACSKDRWFFTYCPGKKTYYFP